MGSWKRRWMRFERDKIHVIFYYASENPEKKALVLKLFLFLLRTRLFIIKKKKNVNIEEI